MKKVTSTEEFIKTLRNRKLDEIRGVYDSLKNYSFWILSVPDRMVRKLEANTNLDPYKDTVTAVVNKQEEPQQKKAKKKAVTLEDTLMQYGFNAISPNDFQNLRVSLTKTDRVKQGFLSKFFGY